MLKTFRLGGIHPAENKLSANKAIEPMDIPVQVIIPLAQHIGAPAKAVVKKGDQVKVGTLIAEASGFVSANIHSSVSGTVVKVDNAPDASGNARPAVFIKVDGDEWEPSIDRSPDLVKEFENNSKDIIDKITAAGLVGLGGATFPTHVKLLPPADATPEVVVINAVECEPYLTSDHQLMLEKADEIVVGVRLLMAAVTVGKAIIGIENNKPDAIKRIREAIGDDSSIVVEALKVQYPQGGEKQLIDACLKRQVASGALPISTGAIVQNVGTAFAVYEAVQKNKPLIERVVTVTGKSVANPCNVLARIGTPIASLIDKAGGLPDDTGKVVFGGPMMGKAMPSVDSMVTKGCSGILVIADFETRRKEMTDCIRCTKCLTVCPMGLDPTRLMRMSELGMFEELESERVMDCIECGSCSYICPSNRTLLDYIRLGKGKCGAIIRNRAANAQQK